MLWLPWPSVEVVKLATPPDNVTVPSTLALLMSRKVTVPVGVPPPPALVTVAVKVTDWPTMLGLSDDVTLVVVLPLTVWVRDPELPLKFVSPL